MPNASTRRFPVLTLNLLLFCAFTRAYTQEKSANSMYVELATQRPAYSINYERIIRQGNKLDYSFSVGFSIAKNAVALPVGFHFITAPGDHHLEFGLRVIPFIDYNTTMVGSVKNSSDTYIYINPGIGYRYQPKQTSLFFKAIAGPSILLDPPAGDFWSMDPALHAFGNLALGISF